MFRLEQDSQEGCYSISAAGFRASPRRICAMSGRLWNNIHFLASVVNCSCNPVHLLDRGGMFVSESELEVWHNLLRSEWI